MPSSGLAAFPPPRPGPRRRRRGCRRRRNPHPQPPPRFPFSPCFQCMPSLVPSQPKIRGAGRCASEVAGRRIWMRCQPKLPGGASRCATGRLRMRVVMLREFRVSDRLLSYRPSSAPFAISTEQCPLCHIDRAVPPLPYRPSSAPLCHIDRAVPPLPYRPNSVPLSLRPGSAPCHFDRAGASGEICGALRQTGAREGPFCALG